MQQFARRPEPEQPENTPKVTISNDSVTQLLDQLTSLERQVAEIRAEVSSVRSENQRLRLQVTGLLGTSEPTAAPIAPVAEVKVVAVNQDAPAKVENPELDKPLKESVDEEFLVDLVRATGLKSDQEITEPQKEEPREQMSDDDIQRMLAEAALGAFDAAKLDWETVEEAPLPTSEKSAVEVSEVAPDLHLIEDVPLEVTSYKVAGPFDLDRTVLAKVPANLAIAALAVPHRFDGTKLVCKVAQPYDYPSLGIIADAIACEVVPEPAEIEQVLAALRLAYSDESQATEKDALWSVSTDQPKRKRGLFRRSA